MPVATKPAQLARAVLKPGGNRVVAAAEHPTKGNITKKKAPSSPPKDVVVVVAPPEFEESVVRANVSVDSTCSSDSFLSGSSNKNKNNKNIGVVIKPKGRVNNGNFISQSPKNSSGPPKRCDWITPNADPLYTAFHDEEWGVPVNDDKKLFELLVFSQALAEYSWPAILSQRHIFRKLFETFEPSSVSQFTDKKLLTLKINGSLLLSEPKLRAIVENAKQIVKVEKEFGSFSNYCWRFVKQKPVRNEYRYGRQVPVKTPKAEVISKDMMRRGFQCVGPTVVYSFMQLKEKRRKEKMLEAMESSVNGGFSQLQSYGDSSEEELSVLPRHTKVVVTGNNRTKSVLVGLQGVVKKAVGLGGWHWLVLTNGIEVKLQRNALSVIEAPTGNEEDNDLEFENLQWNGSDMASDDTHKSHKSRHRTHRSLGSSHKTMSRSFSGDSQSKGSVSMPNGSTKVDLSKLEMAALWRYWRHFNLVDAVPNPSKEQLVDVVQRHFMSQQMDELQVIVGFVQAAKRLKTVCN